MEYTECAGPVPGRADAAHKREEPVLGTAVCGAGADHLYAECAEQWPDVRADDSGLWLHAAKQDSMGYPVAGGGHLYKSIRGHRLLPVPVLSGQAEVYTLCRTVDSAVYANAASGNIVAHTGVAVPELGVADEG